MPWIVTIHEDDWDGELASLKEEVLDPKAGRVDLDAEAARHASLRQVAF